MKVRMQRSMNNRCRCPVTGGESGSGLFFALFEEKILTYVVQLSSLLLTHIAGIV